MIAHYGSGKYSTYSYTLFMNKLWYSKVTTDESGATSDTTTGP